MASNQARNFFQQANRIIANNDIKTSKGGKKGSFKDPVKILINNLGGDPANLTCGGKAISNDTAKGDFVLFFKPIKHGKADKKYYLI